MEEQKDYSIENFKLHSLLLVVPPQVVLALVALLRQQFLLVQRDTHASLQNAGDT
jgi:hypothetical protein